MSGNLASHLFTHSFIRFSENFGYLLYFNIHVCTDGTKNINKIAVLFWNISVSGVSKAALRFGHMIGGIIRLNCDLLQQKDTNKIHKRKRHLGHF